MSVKRTILLLMVMVGSILLVVGVVSAQEQTPPPTDATEQLSAAQDTGTQQLAPAQQTSSSVSALGSVEANMVANIQFQATRTVVGVYTQVGDYVNAADDWYRVTYNGQPGWVSGEYVSKVAACADLALVDAGS